MADMKQTVYRTNPEDRERRFQRRIDNKRRYNDPSAPENRYRMHLEDFRKNQLLNEESRRQKELQMLNNKGLLDVENRRQIGELNRTKLIEAGSTGRTKLTEAGLTGRTKLTEAGLDNRSNVAQSNIMKVHGDTLSLERDKALFDQFAKMKGLDNTGLGGANPVADGDIMGQWKTFRDNAVGMTDQTLDFAIAKKLNDAKAKGIPASEINFTEAERGRLGSGMNSSLVHAPSNRSDFSGVQDQLMASHKRGAGMQQAEEIPITNRVPFIAPNPVQEPIYGPQYRGSVNPLSRVNRNRPVNPNWFEETFGPFGHGVNPRYSK